MQITPILALIIALTLISPVHAASPSPRATPPLSEVTENLKKRLQESIDTKDVSPLSQARAYVGVVKDVIGNAVIIEDKDGKKDIKLGDDTSIVRSPGNAVIKAENIRIDDNIIAIGFPSDNETLAGRRLVVSSDTIDAPKKSSGLGVISKIDKTTITLQIGDHDQIITLTGKTIYKSAAGSIELSDLSSGDTIVYTATTGTDTTTASIIMRTHTASIE